MNLETAFGVFRTSCHIVDGEMIVSFVCDDVKARTPIVRIHSGCIFGDAFHSQHCDCGQQKDAAMKEIKKHGRGVFVYSPFQEGRGHGLEVKIREMDIAKRNGWDRDQAFRSMDLDPDIRKYHREVEVLKELDIPNVIIHFSGNPRKSAALEAGGFEILEHREWTEPPGQGALEERRWKRDQGYTYRPEVAGG